MRRCRTRQPTFLIRCARFSVTTGAALIVSATAIGQTKNYPLDSPDGLRLHNVTGEPVVLQGKKGLRLTASKDVLHRLEGMTDCSGSSMGLTRPPAATCLLAKDGHTFRTLPLTETEFQTIAGNVPPYMR
jgi:hypothetical protein